MHIGTQAKMYTILRLTKKCSQVRLCYETIYIYIYAFSRRFYPKRLTLHSSYSFYILSTLAFPGNRTHDLRVASAMLYQLSYRKATGRIYSKQATTKMVKL